MCDVEMWRHGQGRLESGERACVMWRLVQGRQESGVIACVMWRHVQGRRESGMAVSDIYHHDSCLLGGDAMTLDRELKTF